MDSGQRPNRISILGVDIDGVTMAEARRRIERLVQDARAAGSGDERSPSSRAHAAAGGVPGAHVVTANPELVMEARRNPEFAEALRRADLVLPDGIGIVWAARLLGRSVPERVPGIELTEALLETAADRGYKVFLLGAAPGVADEAAASARRRYPALRVVGTHHGYFSAEEEPSVVQRITDAAPDLLLVALGAPRQELFIARHRRRWNVPVAMGVGGTFDVWAGRARRAPAWIRAVGLEWLYRLLREPRRLKRAPALPRFAALVLLDALRRNLL